VRVYYDKDGITIYHGDCLEALPTLQEGSADAIVTDPPYMLGHAAARRSADKPMGWSEVNNAAFWYTAWMREVWRAAGVNAPVWIFANTKSLPVLYCAAAGVGGMHPVSVLVWDKQWPSVGSTRGLRQNYELVVLFGKPDFKIRDRSVPDIWQCKWAGHKPTGHPAEKPMDLVARMLEVSGTPAGGIVLDPFMGSGTTLHGAKNTGRRAIGIEIDERYCEMAARRLEQSVPFLAAEAAPAAQADLFAGTESEVE
jgi:site-specific DNA-methyltransferase (adenine-specific)